MTTDQSRSLLKLLGHNPDEAVGEEPKYIALVRIFDPEAADQAKADHDDKWSKPPPPIPKRGSAAKTLGAKKGEGR